MATVRSAIVMGLLSLSLVAACQSTGRTFQITLTTEVTDPLPVTTTDETGLVTGISQAAADPATTANDLAVHADSGDPSGFVLTWLGGACDQDTTVWFGQQNGAYVLNLAIHERAGLGCPALGVPRAIRIAVSRPIPVDSIVVAGG